ncbi:hypothetical protein PV403_23925 [Paenibacillus sp. GYB006]|uniref:hypothetical protein n=1 Tax=Paenibacillus sp. GYB006 TaxID=2994394 RepID=UPI002F96E3C8
MQNETIVLLAVIAAFLQVIVQFLGVVKAFIEWLTARNKGKGSDRSHRSKPKKPK